MVKKPETNTTTFQVKEVTDDVMDRLLQDAGQVCEIPLIKVSGQVAERVSLPVVRTLNKLELTSISALLAYVCYNQNAAPETVQAIVEAKFGVNDITKIKESEYQRVIEFLVDLRIDEITN